jgi:hypothetical protein
MELWSWEIYDEIFWRNNISHTINKEKRCSAVFLTICAHTHTHTHTHTQNNQYLWLFRHSCSVVWITAVAASAWRWVMQLLPGPGKWQLHSNATNCIILLICALFTCGLFIYIAGRRMYVLILFTLLDYVSTYEGHSGFFTHFFTGYALFIFSFFVCCDWII